MRLLCACFALSWMVLAASAPAQLRSAFPDAKPVPVYSASERAAAFEQLLHLASPPALGAPVSVTPNAPHAADGTHLDFWKPSFLLGTVQGGEAGFNFWGLHNDGHVNMGFTAGAAKSYALDCRMLSASPITYKVYAGTNATPDPLSQTSLIDSHLLVRVPMPVEGQTILVEMWPTPTTAVMGFLGCDLSPMVP